MKNKLNLSLSFLALFFSIISFAQNTKKTQSELRQERLQQKKETTAFFTDKAELSAVEVPEKWKGESAVILAEEYKYEFGFKSTADANSIGGSNNSLLFKEIVRKRIKIQDKKALEKFSQFYFYGNTGDKFIRIVKPGGQTVNVDMKDAIKVETEIPSYYASYSSSSHKYEKLAVPGLEIGDILDYSFINQEEFYFNGVYLDYPQIIVPLKTDFPMMYQNIEFHIERSNFITARSLNGAPQIQQKPDNSRQFSDFFIESKDVDKKKSEPWDYANLEDPIIKFQVVYAMISERKNINMYFVPAKLGELKREITLDEIKTKINECLNAMAITYAATATATAESIINNMSRNHPEITDKETYLKYAYYQFRSSCFNPKNRSSYYYSYTGGVYNYGSKRSISEFEFLETFKAICKRKKWDCKVGVGIPRIIGKIENIISLNDLEFFPVVDGVAIFNFNKNSLYTGSKEYLDGTKAYIIKNSRNENSVEFDDYQIKATNFEDNFTNDYFKLSVDFNTMLTTVQDSAVSLGYSKKYSSEVIFKNEDVWENEYEITGEKKKKESTDKKKEQKVSAANKKREEEKDRVEKEEKEKQSKEKLDELKELIESDKLSVEKVTDFKLIKDGRSELNKYRIYTTTFSAKDLISKVGNNYIFAIGKVIGEQFIVEDENIERVNNIHLDFSKRHKNVIEIDIPQGYSVTGYEKINQKYENDYISFEVKTRIENNKLIIETEKIYKQRDFSKEHWAEMVKVLKAAQNFNEAKIMFKKL